MLRELLEQNDLIRTNINVKDWEEAVEQGVELLHNAGFVDDRYSKSIIEGTKKHGPYYVICPRVAMPHSRPEDGVKKNGISIMTLEEPVNFGNPDNDPVSIIISLSATDNVSHLEMMQDIVTTISVEDNIDKIEEANTNNDILNIF
ncbi:hypothetical protein SH1V18_23480 [Vallitalea longa]|uniref:Ascorbate-specific PTS system EIIA component n=1 Tax=Vallitalea longa TaxID=2936439 RepID=A0A9W6DFX1_9FIRM|nr:PTS sugar transporter subunit IIA [Vallitalea longa]GKX29868.1 hypothetical protein SH1V18_23480 [Vallitalea longa]